MKPLGLVGDAPAPERLHKLRRLAVSNLALAGKDRWGRRQGDPIFEAVTEGRQNPKYSGCADLGHWLLYRLGCRAPWLAAIDYESCR